MATRSLSTTDLAIEYAPLGRRVGAICIDFIVLALIIVAGDRLSGFCSSMAWVFPFILIPVLLAAYFIACHGQFGQTVGKHLMCMKVVQLSGERIGWPRACMRGSVDLALGALEVVSIIVALRAMPEGESLDGLVGVAAFAAIDPYVPAWQSWVGAAFLAWLALQTIVVLCNRPRRALHDFIAGTVVVNAPRSRFEREDLVALQRSRSPS